MDILFFDKRPMFLMGAVAVTGAYIATGENVIMAVVLAVSILAGALVGKTGLRYVAAAILVVFIFIASGLITSKSFDGAYSEFIGKKCEISGVVSSVESVKEEYTLVVVKAKGFMKKKIKVYIMGCSFELIQGDRVIFTGKLYKPESASNPGGYDGRKILYGDRIAAYSYTDNDDLYLPGGFTLGRVFGLIRKDIRDKCRLFLGNDRGAILAGMLIGDKTMLDSCVKQKFRDSGLSHTMAVSGAHIAYILAPLMLLFKSIGMTRRKYYPFLLLLLLFFAALTGFQPSVCRATLTAGLMLVSGIISRETDALNNIGTSAFILVAINPFTIYDAGFILSYTCVVSILILYKPLVELFGGNPVAKLVALTLAVQAGVLPATTKLFYTVQVFSVVANLLISPIRAVLAIAGWVMYFISTA
ncbi:MAG: ComEC/Rec2 family competence protein, partial [Clostridia bacterium]|nr:ComEC/Rec2 family competence protein [Clostridia bacterium]